MNKISFYRFLCAGLLCLLTACQVAQPFSRSVESGPGDTVAGMNLTTGIQDSKPLQAFCSTARQSATSTLAECSVPMTSRLPVGQIFMLADDQLAGLDRSSITWDLAVDDQPLDLEAFGTIKYAIPELLSSPSRIREAFQVVEAWNVVLTDLEPGEHNITGHARYGATLFTWVMHVSIREQAQLE